MQVLLTQVLLYLRGGHEVLFAAVGTHKQSVEHLVDGAELLVAAVVLLDKALVVVVEPEALAAAQLSDGLGIHLLYCRQTANQGFGCCPPSRCRRR